MDTMKRFFKYLVFIILFWILSDVLIHVGLDSMYKNIKQRGTSPEGIEVIQMQATSVNGRTKIKVTNKDLYGKFLKIDLYSQNDVKLATQYTELGKSGEEIETYFKISEVKSYEISVVEEEGTTTEGFMDTALSTLTIIGIVIKLLAL